LRSWIITLFVLALLAGSASGQGTTIWDESVNGPLSNDYTQPTAFGTFPMGTDSVIGSTQFVQTGNNGAVYGDYFTFVISQSSEITGINLTVDNPVLVWIGNPAFTVQLADVYNPTDGGLLSQMSLARLVPEPMECI
jgi:hypothetical protein